METQVLGAPGTYKAVSVARPDVLYRVALGVLLLGGLVLRLFGIGWGIPNFNPARMPLSAYRNSYHIDEDNYLWGLVQMRPSQGNFDVGDYHWGTLQYYLIYGSLLGGEAVGALPAPWEDAFQKGDIQAIGPIYETGRLVSVLAGVAGIFIVLGLGTLAGGRTAGLGAALAYTVAPFAVVEAHYMTSDVLMSVLVAAGLLLSIVGAQKGSAEWLAGAGLALGLAVSDKYSALFALPALLVAQYLASGFPLGTGFPATPGRRARRAGPSHLPMLSLFGLPWLALIAGFFMGEPYALIAPGKLIAGLQITMDGNATDPSMGLGPPIHMLAWQAKNLAWLGLTPPIALLAALGILLGIVRLVRVIRAHFAERRTGKQVQPHDTTSVAWAVLLTAMAGFLLGLALNRVFMLRYSQPLVPLLCVAAGVGWAAIPRAALRWSAGAVAVAVAAIVTLGQLSIMAGSHPANELLAWLDANIRPGQEIARLWPEYPPLDGGTFKLVRMDPWQPSLPPGDRPDYIIMDNMALGPVTPDTAALIATNYREVAHFSAQPHIGPLAWDEGTTPHDWKYSHPAFTVYARR